MMTIDARAWLVWLFAGAFLAILVGNPLYLVLLLLISRLVDYACAPFESRTWRLPFWRISLMILVFSTLFNMVTAHVGQTVLMTLPLGWPLVGGPLTLEAGLYGLLSGLRLVTLLSFFLAFNTIVPVSHLAGLTPRALHELGLVMLIAITYVPETIQQFHRIRDAQAIRGHKLNSLRAWRPILIPLLISGLERALNLSETMVSRGYGSTSVHGMPLRARLLLIVGLMLALGGALRLSWPAADGWLLLLGGIVSILFAYYDLSRLVSHTRYRPHQWGLAETLVVVGALIALIPILPISGMDRYALTYSPYPAIVLPSFTLWVGIGLFGFCMPAFLVAVQARPVEILT